MSVIHLCFFYLNKECANLTDIDNAVMQVTAGVAGIWSFETAVTFTCEAGYYLSPNLPIICSSNGSWNDPQRVCERVTCIPPITPNNGSYSPEKSTYNYSEMVEFVCQLGFDLIGLNSSECIDKDQWSEGPPLCQLKDCGILTDPTNGKVWHTDGTRVGATAYYTCSEGSTLNGTTSRTCNESGVWTSESPTCDVIRKCIIDTLFR